MRGQIRITRGLVLSSRIHKESDRLSVIYTEEFGKLNARFIGVHRPAGKLKAVSETLVLGEYRLYLRDGGEFATAAGGVLETGYPGLRGRLDALLRGMEICELLERLTPFWKPNPEKFALAVECLAAQEKNPSGAPWLLAAYTLRLLESAGFGLSSRSVSEENRSVWEALHYAAPADVAGLPDEPAGRQRLEAFLRASVEKVTERPLAVAKMRDELLQETVTTS